MTTRSAFTEPEIEDFDRELIRRGTLTPEAQRFRFQDNEGTPQRSKIMESLRTFYASPPPPSPSPGTFLENIETGRLVGKLLQETRQTNAVRGKWSKQDRSDFYELQDDKIVRNACSVAAICMESDLSTASDDFCKLSTKNYGRTFNLRFEEPYRNQPVAAGPMSTGFLVAENILATAGHCVDDGNLKDLRFIFGFKLTDSISYGTEIPVTDIYRGVKIVGRRYAHGAGADWALVELDRPVIGRSAVFLSATAPHLHQPVYIIGHPCGLPLKFAPGAEVITVGEDLFSATLDVYSGNSGSPVFSSDSHDVVGIVVRGDCQDFRWVDNGWVSIIYPNPTFKSQAPQCTRISAIIDVLERHR